MDRTADVPRAGSDVVRRRRGTGANPDGGFVRFPGDVLRHDRRIVLRRRRDRTVRGIVVPITLAITLAGLVEGIVMGRCVAFVALAERLSRIEMVEASPSAPELRSHRVHPVRQEAIRDERADSDPHRPAAWRRRSIGHPTSWPIPGLEPDQNRGLERCGDASIAARCSSESAPVWKTIWRGDAVRGAGRSPRAPARATPVRCRGCGVDGDHILEWLITLGWNR